MLARPAWEDYPARGAPACSPRVRKLVVIVTPPTKSRATATPTPLHRRARRMQCRARTPSRRDDLAWRTTFPSDHHRRYRYRLDAQAPAPCRARVMLVTAPHPSKTYAHPPSPTRSGIQTVTLGDYRLGGAATPKSVLERRPPHFASWWRYSPRARACTAMWPRWSTRCGAHKNPPAEIRTPQSDVLSTNQISHSNAIRDRGQPLHAPRPDQGVPLQRARLRPSRALSTRAPRPSGRCRTSSSPAPCGRASDGRNSSRTRRERG